jgi:hypothetical protein
MISRVVGAVVAREGPRLEGLAAHRQTVSPEGEVKANSYLIAVDTVGAGVNDCHRHRAVLRAWPRALRPCRHGGGRHRDQTIWTRPPGLHPQNKGSNATGAGHGKALSTARIATCRQALSDRQPTDAGGADHGHAGLLDAIGAGPATSSVGAQEASLAFHPETSVPTPRSSASSMR